MENKVYFKQFDIEIIKLPLGFSDFQLNANKLFFEKHPNDEILDANVGILINVEKKENLIAFNFHLRGTLTLKCDICLENLSYPLDVKDTLIIKQGNKSVYDINDESIVYLSPDAYKYNVEQIVYELICSNIPMRKVHGDYEGQECNKEMSRILKKLQKSENKERTDPRWDALKDLKL